MPGRHRWMEVQFTHSYPQHHLQASGQFNAIVALPTRYPMHIRQYGLHSLPRNSLAPARNQTMIPQSFSPQLSPRLLNLLHAACPSVQFFFFCPSSFSIVWRMCVYIQIFDCVETEHEFLVLANNTAGRMFLHKLPMMRTVDCIFITGVHAWWWLGEYMILDKTF